MAQAARMKKNGDGPTCFPVSPHLILPRARGEFEVYLKQSDKLVLYAGRGERFTEAHRAKLVDLGVEQVWISATDHDGYERYVAKYLGEILEDETIPIDRRVETWSDVSVSLLEGMLGRDLPDEVFRAGFARMKHVVRNSVRFFIQPVALKELSYYMGKGFSSHKHGLTVMVYTGALLSTFGDLSFTVISDICVGTMLHDIGKTRLSSELLDKNPRLRDKSDRAALSSHPALGVSVCSRLSLPQEALNCILFHHERCDGSGYPSGARKDALPVYARAVALANQYDNLTRATAYKKGCTPFEALTGIKNEGEAFDQELLRRFIMVLSNAKIV